MKRIKLSLRLIATSDPAQIGKYDVLEREVYPEEAFEFLKRLVSPEDIIFLEGTLGSLDFWKHEDCLWVELYSDALWATSQISEIEAKAIIDMLAREENFDYCIPTTMRVWDAYAPLDDNLIQQGGK